MQAVRDRRWLLAEVERLTANTRLIIASKGEGYGEAFEMSTEDRLIVERLTSYLDAHIGDDFSGEQLAEDVLRLVASRYADVRTEWGVHLTWPDGRSEVHERPDERLAHSMADWHNSDDACSICSAVVVTRTVTTSDWVAALNPDDGLSRGALV